MQHIDLRSLFQKTPESNNRRYNRYRGSAVDILYFQHKQGVERGKRKEGEKIISYSLQSNWIKGLFMQSSFKIEINK